MREQGELAYENLNMMLTVQKLTEENQRLREALRDNETYVKTWSDEYDAMKAEIERLQAALVRIQNWYPISVANPRWTIKEIQEFAHAAREAKA